MSNFGNENMATNLRKHHCKPRFQTEPLAFIRVSARVAQTTPRYLCSAQLKGGEPSKEQDKGMSIFSRRSTWRPDESVVMEAKCWTLDSNDHARRRAHAVVTFAIGEGADAILACSCAAFGTLFFVN